MPRAARQRANVAGIDNAAARRRIASGSASAVVQRQEGQGRVAAARFKSAPLGGHEELGQRGGGFVEGLPDDDAGKVCAAKAGKGFDVGGA